MKVIFLDFDGVINQIGSNVLVNPVYVDRLKTIIERTHAKIVVTSFNKNEFVDNPLVKYEETKYYKYYLKPLFMMGIEIFDCTSFIDVNRNIRRETEISQYLSEHPEIEEFVIIEDDFIIHQYEGHQVFIEYAGGIQPEHIEPAINILNGHLGFYPPDYDQTETLENRFARILKYLGK